MNGFDLQRQFRSVGYHKVSDALSDDGVNRLNALLDEEFADPNPAFRTVYSAGVVATKLYDILQRPFIGDAIKKELHGSEKLEPVLTSLLGPNVSLTLNRHNHATNNYPGENEVRMHRDVLHWSRNIVSAIVYLDEARVEDGSTVVVPGSHLEPFVGVTQPEGGGTWMDEHSVFDGLEDKAEPVPAVSGDILLFDATLFHTNGGNISGRRRRSIALGLKAVDELTGLAPGRESLFMGHEIYRGNDRTVSV